MPIVLDRRRGVHVSSLTYVLRDRFPVDVNPITTPRSSSPGPGTLTVTGASFWKILANRLRGGSQPAPATPTWGNSKLVGASLTRVTGRTIAALVTLEDAGAECVIGWATATNIGDPRADGHAWAGGDTQQMALAIPGAEVVLDTTLRGVRPMTYLAIISLQDQGAYVLLSTFADDLGGALDGRTDLIGIPAYPSARLLWATPTGTTTPLYPSIQCKTPGNGTAQYPSGVAIEDLRVVDVAGAWATADGLANAADRFTRADSAVSIGGAWTVIRGTWGIASNQGYLATDPGGAASICYLATTIADGMYCVDITVPAGWNGSNASFGVILRRQDNSNFIRIWNNNANQLAIQTWVAGAFGATIYSTARTWVAGATNRWVILTSGNQYNIWVDGVSLTGNAWKADVNSRFITSTGVGLYGGQGNAQSGAVRWDNLAALPHTISLPSEIRSGKVPTVVNGGAVLGQDTFTDTNGTRLNAHTAESGGAWVESIGTWTIQSNAAQCATVNSDVNHANYAYQTLIQGNAEASVDLVMHASLNDTTGTLRSGILLRDDASQNYIRVSAYKDPAQINSDEIEIYESIGNSSNVVHKVNLGHKYLAGVSYTLKAQVLGDLVMIFLNGYPRMSLYTSVPFTGVRFGLIRIYEDAFDGVAGHAGTTFDNWVVRAL